VRTWAKSSPVTAGVVLAAVGVLALFLAWNGAAGVDHVEGQIPYLISGGLLGIALVGAGLTIVNVQARRQDTADVLAKLDELAEALQRTGEPGAPALSLVPGGEVVVAGRSTYHLPSCRVVAERDDLQPMAPASAAGRGLSRCRLCKPPAAASA
jgi:hypothetical protein